MENLKLKDFLDYKYLSNLEFSPNGENAGFVVHTTNYDDNNYQSNIWLLNNKTKKYSKLTSLNEEKSFLWIDNSTIIFPASRDAKLREKVSQGEKWTAYYSIDINGGEADKYMQIPLLVTAIKMIDKDNFVLTAQYDNYGINLNELTGEERSKAVAKLKEEKDYEVLDEIPFWSNGGGFTNQKRNRLYLYNRISNEVTPLSCEHTVVTYFSYKDGKVLYVGNLFEGKLEQREGIFCYDIASKTTETLLPIDANFRVTFAEFLEDTVICALNDCKEYGMNQNPSFYIIKNGKVELLKKHDTWMANTVGSDCRYGGGKSYRVANGKLYFPTTVFKDSFLNTIDLAGNETVLTKADGSVDVYDVHGDEILFAGLRGIKLQEIYSLKDGEETQITKFNENIYTDKKISIPEKCNFVNDGIEIEGWVLKPVDYDETKTYPAILDIHGGPKTVFGEVFYHEMQVWANMGYFVFFCNPRGGDGRGNAFADIRGKYGTIDYDDLMKFTDVVLEKYPIKADRVGVTGGSYGGYMTNWIIGHTDRFRCAASQRSIANWISKFGTTDIGYYFNADQNASTPWINQEKLWWHSPMKYADKVKTPTLFIHSEEDYRCWLAEGIQMFTALKYHGVEARLCMFRGENHELSRSGKPKHRVRRLEEMTNWFEKYLKD
ncbi:MULTISPECIES: alpha/beta hydrolase family protein [Fusobacterium]|jgi:dipeptidyl aminopeptidase/acylaminoacyl peptidase|uniref:alpha/beta hydrolase family protein n=1 Tax=Fusobacterium TaxID=848 RepID=UPI0008A1F416|nr:MULTISPECIES: S9 family peptidase [Fusobacterium]MCF0170165.1 S9 family peptidase [Fusobacterium varium]MCF2673027.1 S9 family peptidase [Fusobacterium varium]OFL86489.1 peptidase S9 [Fusobacterium sp. HMSC073F01]RHG36846.1 S9 family peptidase [Fusobacterium varium]HBJ78584.1 S9 family peptidase [Fusobacterium sp.]